MTTPPRRHWLAGAAIAIGTLILTTGPLYRVRTWWRFDDPLAADVAVVTVQLVVGATALVAILTGGRWRRVDARFGLVAVALVGWMALGSLWSADASTTLRESLIVGVTLLAGVGAAVAVSERILVTAAWVGVQVGLAWSAVLIVGVQPGSQNADEEWTGVYFNPNTLALVATFGILLTIVLAVQYATHSRRVWILIVLGAAVLADGWLISGTGSLAPLVALLVGGCIGAGAVVARRWVRSDHRRTTDATWIVGGAGVGLVGVGAIAWWQRDVWLPWVGRSSDVTGRTEMWGVALEWFRDRPLTGHGYLGAWSDPEFVSAMLEARGQVLGSTHNTFVELLLGTGLVGLGLALALFGFVWLVAGVRALTSTGWLAVWPLVAVVFLIVENLAETLWVGGQLSVAVLGALAVVSAGQEPSEPLAETGAGDVVGVGLEQRN